MLCPIRKDIRWRSEHIPEQWVDTALFPNLEDNVVDSASFPGVNSKVPAKGGSHSRLKNPRSRYQTNLANVTSPSASRLEVFVSTRSSG